MGIEHPILGLMTFAIVASLVIGSIVLLNITAMNVVEVINRNPVIESHVRCFSTLSGTSPYRYLLEFDMANVGGSDLRLEKLIISSNLGQIEVHIDSPSFIRLIGSIEVTGTLRGFTGIELWRGQRGYISLELSSNTPLYANGSLHSIYAFFKTIGFEGFIVAEGRFKVGEIRSCIEPALPPPPFTPPPSLTPFTWQLREYDVWRGYDPNIRFTVTSDGKLLIDSWSTGSSSRGHGYAFRYLPKTLLHGNRIQVRLDVGFSYSGEREVGFVAIVDGAILNRRDISYILVSDSNREPAWDGILRWVKARGIDASGNASGVLLTSSPVNLTGFQDWVTLVLALRDTWDRQTVSLAIHWVAILDPSDRVIANFTFRGASVLMEVTGTLYDYGILDFNTTAITRTSRASIWFDTFFNRLDLTRYGGSTWGRGSGSCGGGWEVGAHGAYGVVYVDSSGNQGSECHIFANIGRISSGTLYIAYRTLLRSGNPAFFGGGFTSDLNYTGVFDGYYAGSFWEDRDMYVVRGGIKIVGPFFIKGNSMRVDFNTWYSGVTEFRLPNEIRMYVRPGEYVSHTLTSPMIPSFIDSFILGVNLTSPGTTRAYFDLVVVTRDVEPWIVKIRGLRPGLTVILRNSTGDIISQGVADASGVATLSIWGYFIVLDATIEVYDGYTLVARRPFTEIVGGDEYVVNLT